MPIWLEDLAGPDYAWAVVYTLAALVLLVVVLLIVKLVRSMTFGTFVAGGRNRKTRLAVMDATAVDSHRRLILVRRDDVEHLLLIGGPTDVVVEQDIRMSGQARRTPAAPEAQAEYAPQPRQRPVEQHQLPVRVEPQRRPTAPAPARAPERQPAQAQPPRQQSTDPRPQPPRMPPAVTTYPAAPTYAPPRNNSTSRAPATASFGDDLDKTLMSELEVTFDSGPPSKTPKPAEVTLEDEMNKLLGELTSHKR